MVAMKFEVNYPVTTFIRLNGVHALSGVAHATPT